MKYVLAAMCFAFFLQAQVAGQFPGFFPVGPLLQVDARIEEASSTVQRELAQIDSLAEANAWDEAVDGMLRLISESSDALVAISDDHYLPLKAACQLRMADWPAEGLHVYRNRVDRTATQMFETAVASRDSEALQRVVDNYFVSSVGDDALLALTDLSLEEGNFSRARGCLIGTSPSLSAPDGRPWGVAIASQQLDAEKIKSIVESTPKAENTPVFLAYPDTNLSVPELMARMVVISLRERNFRRAERELTMLQALYPDARGKLSGREVVLADGLSTAISAAREWPMADSAATKVGELRGVVWNRDLPGSPIRLTPQPDFFPRLGGRRVIQPPIPRRPSLLQPLVGNGRVIYRPETQGTAAAGSWFALDTKSGEPVIGKDGLFFTPSAPLANQPAGGGVIVNGFGPGIRIQNNIQMQIEIRNGVVLQRQVMINGSPSQPYVVDLPLGSLKDDLLYAVVDPQKILALDLAAEGKLKLEIKPSENCRFVTTPLVHGDSIFVAQQQP